MIRIFLFRCERCGYEARVAGGFSDGLDAAAQTIVCEDCKDLQDAVVAARVANDKPTSGKAPLFAEVIKRLSVSGPSHWEQFAPACSVSPQHLRIQIWKQPGKCPRCGAFMEPLGIPLRQLD